MKKDSKLVVLGATGNIGREMLNIVREFKSLSCRNVIACASDESKGREISSGDKILKVTTLDDIKLSKGDIVLSAVSGRNIASMASDITACGAVIIDNSSHFRMHEDVPLVIPEINPDAIADYGKKGIIANPNCSTIQMLVPLKVLHDKFIIKRIIVSTYQAVSGMGKAAMDELFTQTKGMFGAEVVEPSEFQKQIAFNCIPQVGAINKDGYTAEEMKMHNETRKILGGSPVSVSATCVRVPVFNGHAESVNVEFEKPFEMDEVESCLYNTDSTLFTDDHGGNLFCTQAECSQTDVVHVARVRRDCSVPNGLNMWIVADNLRKGGALNAMQIADLLVSKYL